MADEIIDQKRREFLGTSAVALSGVVAGASAMAMPGTVSASSTAVKEPAVIGYPNQKGVTIERVTYPARNTGTAIVANLFKPAGFPSSRKYAAIVVTHPFGGVKEQTAGLYAVRLAEPGSNFPFPEGEAPPGHTGRGVPLPEKGVRGNTHSPMSDLDNVQIAYLLSQYLAEKKLD